MKEWRPKKPVERWHEEPLEDLALDQAEKGVEARIYGEPEYVKVIARIPNGRRAVQLTLADELHVRYSQEDEAEPAQS